MNYFNKKQIEQLQPYETHFHTVIYAKYKRATSSRVNDFVANLYEDVTGEILDRNWSCATCVYNIFEKCGKLYYESIKNESNKKITETNETTGDKKQRTRNSSRNNTKSTRKKSSDVK